MSVAIEIGRGEITARCIERQSPVLVATCPVQSFCCITSARQSIDSQVTRFEHVSLVSEPIFIRRQWGKHYQLIMSILKDEKLYGIEFG